jgi:hypothetical protein
MCRHRDRAISEGALVDVSSIACAQGILFPVAFSAALYSHPQIDRAHLLEHLSWILECAFADPRRLIGDEAGEYTFSVLVDNRTWAGYIRVRAVIEHDEGSRGVVATLMEHDETYDPAVDPAPFYVA